MADLDRRLAATAARQHSLVALADVIAAGGTRSHANDRVAAGRWEHVHRGVYRLAGVPWSYEARVLGGVLAAGSGAVASHLCAARLHGLGFTTASPELSIPRGRFHRPDGLRVHQSTDLDRCDTHRRHGIPVTDPARTLLDLGRYIGPNALHRVIERARRLDLVTWADLVRCLAADARKGLHDADGRLFAELDLAYPAVLAALEIDGGVHLEPEVRERDDARDHELRRRGWLIRRVWWEIPVHQPDQFLRIVRDLLEDARRRELPHPPS